MSRKQPSILSFFNKDGRSVITHVVNNSDTETSLIGEEPAAGAVTVLMVVKKVVIFTLVS